MNRAEFHRHIGDVNIVPSLADGIRRANEILGEGGSPSPYEGVSRIL